MNNCFENDVPEGKSVPTDDFNQIDMKTCLRVLSECERAIILCGFYVVHAHQQTHHQCVCLCHTYFVVLLPTVNVLDYEFHLTFLCRAFSVHTKRSVFVCVWIQRRETMGGQTRLYVVNYMKAATAVRDVRSLEHTLHFALCYFNINLLLSACGIYIYISKSKL